MRAKFRWSAKEVGWSAGSGLQFITIATFFEKMPRLRGDNDLVVKLSNSKFLLVVLVCIKRLLKRLIAMHAIKES